MTDLDKTTRAYADNVLHLAQDLHAEVYDEPFSYETADLLRRLNEQLFFLQGVVWRRNGEEDAKLRGVTQ